MSVVRDFTNGLFKENPTFRLVLGMCPTLAVTTAVANGIGMGFAAAFVLVGSNLMISLIRKMVPDKIRIPVYIVVIATFVTIIDLTMAATVPGIHQVLGIFIPLIVVNCIIMARAEAFASKNPPLNSIADGLGMGLGFTGALVLLSTIREALGTGVILSAPDFGFDGIRLFSEDYAALIMILPPGGFLTLGLLLGFFNSLSARRKG